MDNGMNFDPMQGIGLAKVRSNMGSSGRPDGARDKLSSDKRRKSKAGSSAGTGGAARGNDEAQSPDSMFAEAVKSSSSSSGTGNGEHVATPKSGARAESMARAADAYREATSKSGGEVEAAVEAARESAARASAVSDKKTVRVSAAVMEAVRQEFPGLTNPQALEAFVAYHAARPELSPEKAREDVEKRLRDGNEANGVMAAIRELTRAVATMRTETSISSMASLSVLSHWYEEELGRSGVPASEWLGLNDPMMDIVSVLSSMSAEYREAVRRSHGRTPRGF